MNNTIRGGVSENLKEFVRVGRYTAKKIYNARCGDLGAEHSAVGGKGVWGQSPQRLVNFTIFQ